MENNSNEQVWIIDTDYSLDDQLAFNLLIGKLKIVAITVVSVGDTHPNLIKRKIEDDLKTKFDNVNIPVYAGADRPYVNYERELKDDPIFDAYNVRKTDYSQYESNYIEEATDIKTKLNNVASVKIIELCKLYGNKLNILTLGPLTNISLAAIIDNSIRDKIGAFFIVGGSYNNLGNSGNAAEYNFRADPIAAKNVINYCRNVTLFPLELEQQIDFDALKKCKLDSQFEEIFSLIYTNSEDQTRSYYSLLGYFASIVILNLSCVKSQHTKPTDVDIIGRLTRGALIIEKYDYLKSGKFNEINIIEEVDPLAMLDLLSKN